MGSASDSGRSVLVTGGQGFVGTRLTAALAERHDDWLIETPSGPHSPSAGADRPKLDITDTEAVTAWIRERRPDVVVHLAAVSAVTASVRDPRLAWRVNLQGTLNLVLALQAHAPGCHLLYVSSAEVYGASFNNARTVDETAVLQPLNPYAASKAAADILVRQAAAAGLSTTVMRPFNHTGAGQSEAFVGPSFAGQIARIEAGLKPPVLSVGSLDEQRDFLDVQDVVAAYIAALEGRDRLQPGEVFNVASGRPVRIGDVLEHLLSLSRVSIRVEVDSARLRPAPIVRMVGDATRLRERLGWQPTIPLDRTLRALLDEGRQRAVGLGAGTVERDCVTSP